MNPWNATMNLGHEDADTAHRELHDLAFQAAGAMAREDVADLGASLRALTRASVDHFAWEEGEMARTAYPEAAAHRDAHLTFLLELRRIAKELNEHGVSPLFRLWFGSRFVDWMRFHVLGADAQLMRHLRLAAAAAPAPGPTPAGATATAPVAAASLAPTPSA